MMYQNENAGMEAKIKFLDRAAQTYALKAPSLSAYVMLERAATAEKLGVTGSKEDRKDVCRACGTLLISGVTSKVSLNPGRNSRAVSKVSKRNDRSKSTPSEKSLETHCLACYRFSKVSILPSKRQKFGWRRHVSAENNLQPSAPSVSPAAAKVVDASNKRTKTRRIGGLQALVQRAKESQQTSTSFGMDLMDFMKEG